MHYSRQSHWYAGDLRSPLFDRRMSVFSTELLQLRLAFDWSRDVLADKLYCCRKTVYNMESGKGKVRLATLKAVEVLAAKHNRTKLLQETRKLIAARKKSH